MCLSLPTRMICRTDNPDRAVGRWRGDGWTRTIKRCIQRPGACNVTEQGTIEQTYPPGKHPSSLANLRPWSPGQSGCPSGQRASGAYVAEWRNAMLGENDDGTARYTRADLEAVVADDAAPPAKIIAAVWILNCMKTGQNWVIGKDGKLMPARIDSEPGRERERLMDRIEGKPAQHVNVTQHAPSLQSLEAELRTMVAQDPTLPGRMRAMLAQVAGADATVLPAAIETTAQPID